MSKAAYPMLVTFLGIVTLVRLAQLLKVTPSMLVKLGLVGNITLARLVQSLKTLFPMLVTLFGMNTLFLILFHNSISGIELQSPLSMGQRMGLFIPPLPYL